MVGKLRIHEATVERVVRSEQYDNCYVIRIKYGRRDRQYPISVYEGSKGMKAVKKFLNVDNIEKLEGRTVSYIAANDIDEPSKAGVWMLANKDGTLFLDLKTYNVLSKQQVKKEITKFVFSEF